MRQDESFGVIPLQKQKGEWVVFLIQHQQGGGYWSFPKGHAESDETHQESAVRELKEETNLDIVRFLQDEPLIEEYSFVMKGERIYKKVYYFLAEVDGEASLQKIEVRNGVWVPLDKALHQVTYSAGKSILAQVRRILHG